MGPPASYRVTRVRYYSGVTWLYRDFAYGSFTLCALLFQNSSTILAECPYGDPQPRSASTAVWPLPRSLAATWRIDVSFSSWSYLDVSVHPVSFSHTMCSYEDTYLLQYVGSPIRRSAGRRIFAPHRSFSQLVTSFFGSQCQGIRLMLFLT